jgi:hypothetical protein
MPGTSDHKPPLIPPSHAGKRKRYRSTYLLLIDIFGVLGLASAVAYYWYASTAQFPDQELLSLWQNASSEAIGIYASVRVIEFLVRTNQERREARVGLIKTADSFILSRTRQPRT